VTLADELQLVRDRVAHLTYELIKAIGIGNARLVRQAIAAAVAGDYVLEFFDCLNVELEIGE
jgi:hypothetical protein